MGLTEANSSMPAAIVAAITDKPSKQAVVIAAGPLPHHREAPLTACSHQQHITKHGGPSMQRSCTPSSVLDQAPPCNAAATAAAGAGAAGAAAEQKQQQQQLAGTALPPALMEKAAELLNSEDAATTPRRYTARELLQASASGSKGQQHPPASWQKLASQLLSSSSDTDEDVTSRRHDACRTDQQQAACAASRPGAGDTLLPCRLEQRFLLQGASPSLQQQQQQQQQACQQQLSELFSEVSCRAADEPAQGPGRLQHSAVGTSALQQRLAARARDVRLSAEDLGQLDMQQLSQLQHHSTQQPPPLWSGRSSRSSSRGSSRSDDGTSPGSLQPPHGVVRASQPPGSSSSGDVGTHHARTSAHNPRTAAGSRPSRLPVHLRGSGGGIGRHRAANISSSGHHVLRSPQQASTAPASSHPPDTCSRSPLLRASAAVSSGDSAGARCRPQQRRSTDFHTPAGHLCAAYVLPSTAQHAHAACSTHEQPAYAASAPSRGASARARTAQQDSFPALGQVMAPWKLSAWLMKADTHGRPQRLVRRARAVNLSSGSEDDAADSTSSSSSSSSDGDSSSSSGNMGAGTKPEHVHAPPQASVAAMCSPQAQLLSTQQRLSWQPRSLMRQDSSSSSSSSGTTGSAQAAGACAAGGAAESGQDLTHANDLVNRLLCLLAENHEQQQEQEPAQEQLVAQAAPSAVTARAAVDARSVACQTGACPTQGDVQAAAASSRAAAFADATCSLDSSRTLVEQLLLSLQQLEESQPQSAAVAVSTAECQTAPCQAEALAAVAAIAARSRAAAYADVHSALGGSRALVEQLLLVLGEPDALGAVQADVQTQLVLAGDPPGLPLGALGQAHGLSRASSSCSSSSLSTCSSLRFLRHSLAAADGPAAAAAAAGTSTDGVPGSPPAPADSVPDEGAAAVSAARGALGVSFPVCGLSDSTDEKQPAATLSPASSGCSSSSLSTCSSLPSLRGAADPAGQTSAAAAETAAVVPEEPALRGAGADVALKQSSASLTAAAAEASVSPATAPASSCSSPRRSSDMPAPASDAQLDVPACLAAAASSRQQSAEPADQLMAADAAAVGPLAADAISGRPGSSTTSPGSGESTPFKQPPMGSSLNSAPPAQAVGGLAGSSSPSSRVEAAPAAAAPTVEQVSAPLPAAVDADSEGAPSQLWASFAASTPRSSSEVIGEAEPLTIPVSAADCAAASSAAPVADVSAGIGGCAGGSRVDSPCSGSVSSSCAGEDAAPQDLRTCPDSVAAAAQPGPSSTAVSALLGATAALPVPSAAAVAQLDVAVQPAGEQHFDFGAAGHPVESEAAAGSSASGSGWDLLEAAQSAALGAGGSALELVQTDFAAAGSGSKLEAQLSAVSSVPSCAASCSDDNSLGAGQPCSPAAEAAQTAAAATASADNHAAAAATGTPDRASSSASSCAEATAVAELWQAAEEAPPLPVASSSCSQQGILQAVTGQQQLSEPAGAVAVAVELPAVTALIAAAAELYAAGQPASRSRSSSGSSSSSSSSADAVLASFQARWGLVMQELLVVMQQRGSNAEAAAAVAAVTSLAPAVADAPVTAGLCAAVGAPAAQGASSMLQCAAVPVQALPTSPAPANCSPPAVSSAGRVPDASSSPSDADRQGPPPRWRLVMQELQAVLAGRAAAAVAASVDSSTGAVVSHEPPQQQHGPLFCVQTTSAAAECCPEASSGQPAAASEPGLPQSAQELSSSHSLDADQPCSPAAGAALLAAARPAAATAAADNHAAAAAATCTPDRAASSASSSAEVVAAVELWQAAAEERLVSAASSSCIQQGSLQELAAQRRLSEAAGVVTSAEPSALPMLPAAAAGIRAAHQLASRSSSSSSSTEAVPASFQACWGLVMQELMIVMQQRGSSSEGAADVAVVTLPTPAVADAPVTAGPCAAVCAGPAQDVSSVALCAADGVQALPASTAAAPTVSSAGRVPDNSSSPSDADRQGPPPRWRLVMQELQAVLAGRAAAGAGTAAVANSSGSSTGAIISQEQQQQQQQQGISISKHNSSAHCASSPEAQGGQPAARSDPHLTPDGSAGAPAATVRRTGDAQPPSGQALLLQELKQRQAAAATLIAAVAEAACQLGFEQPAAEGSGAVTRCMQGSSTCRSSSGQADCGLESVADDTSQPAVQCGSGSELQAADSGSSSDRDDALAAGAEQPGRGPAVSERQQLGCQGLPPQAASAGAVTCHSNDSSSSSADANTAAVQQEEACGSGCNLQVCQHSAEAVHASRSSSSSSRSSSSSSSGRAVAQMQELGGSAAAGTCAEACELSLRTVVVLGQEAAATGAATCSPGSEGSSTSSSDGGSGSTSSSPRGLESGASAAAEEPSCEEQECEQHEQQQGQQLTAECAIDLAGGSSSAAGAAAPCSRASSSFDAVLCAAQSVEELLDAALTQQALDVIPASQLALEAAAPTASSSSSRHSSGAIDGLIDDLLQAVLLQDTCAVQPSSTAAVLTGTPTSRTSSTGSLQQQSDDPGLDQEQDPSTCVDVLSAAAASLQPSSELFPLQPPAAALAPPQLAADASSSAGLESAAALGCSSPLWSEAEPAAVRFLLGRAQSAPTAGAGAAVVPLTRSSSCALYERAGRTAQCQPAASAAAHHACAVPDAAFCSNDSTSCSRSSSSKLSVVATVAASPHSSHSSPAWQLVATAGPLATLGVPEGSLPQHDCGTECQESGGAALSSSAAPEEGLCSPSLSHSSANDALQHSSEDAQQLNSSTEPQGWRAADASGDADADPLQPAADGAGLPLSTAADDLQATASFQVAHPAAVSCENSSAVPLAADSSASISPQNSSSSSSSFEAAAAGFAPAHSPAAPAAGEGAESLDVTDTATGCTTADSRSGLLVALTVLGDGRVLVGLMPWQAAHVASTAEQQTGDAALSCDAALALDFAAAAGAAQDAAQQASPGSCCGVLASDTSGSAADEHTTCADSPVAASDLGVAEAPSLAVVLQDAASSDHTATGLAAAPSGATLAVALSEAVPTAAEIMGEPCLLAAQASSGVHAQPSAADTADAQEATPATEAEAPPASMAANNCAGSEPAAVDAVSCQEPLPMDALSSASSSSLAQLVAEVGHAVAALAASPLQEADSPQQQPSQGGSTAEIGTPGLLAEVPSSAATSSQFDALTTGCGGCSVPAQAGCSVDAGTSSLRDAEQAASPTSTSLRGQQQLPAPLPSLPLLEGSASWGLMCAPTWQRAHSPFGSAAAQGVWDELAAAAPLQGVSTSTQQVAPGLPSHLEAGSCTLGAGSAASLGADTSYVPPALEPAVRSYSSSSGGDISGSSSATSLAAASEKQQCAGGGAVAGDAAGGAVALAPAGLGHAAQVGTAAGLLDQYLQQQSCVLPERPASAMQLTTVSEGISTCSSSSHATRCALEQPQDQACSEASVSLQQAQQQQGSDRTRNTGIGRFSLADVGSPAAQGLKIHSISLDFSLCSGTSSTSARSERQPAAAAAQAVCGPSPASGVQASPSGNLGETLDEAGGSLAALDTILCCLEALAQAVLLRSPSAEMWLEHSLLDDGS